MTLLAINKARFLKTEVSKHSHRFLLRIQILKTRGKKKLVYKNLKLIQRYRLKCAATEIQWHYTHPIVGLNSQSLAAKGATRHANPGLTSPPYQKKYSPQTHGKTHCGLHCINRRPSSCATLLLPLSSSDCLASPSTRTKQLAAPSTVAITTRIRKGAGSFQDKK
jgi:hypothetical protein